uniref:Urokinase plasminogen activator surface receptor n=1 Tax=Chinchilla lanigera TaxID=34839 RepID=A0A8C2UL28_CHILA
MDRPLQLLLCVLICTPVSWALLCLQCVKSGPCQPEVCASGEDLCRTTVINTSKVLGLRDSPHQATPHRFFPPGQPRTFTLGRYLECVSCSSLDMSCERGRDQSLQCRHPREQCVEVVTHDKLEVTMKDERHTRGCGFLPGCPGPTGFHSNHSFHYLQCCNTTNCNRGPVIELQNLPPNGIQCYSCQGNSTHGCSSSESSLIDCRGPMIQCLHATGTKGLENQTFTVRGCATASWCRDSHVADTFGLTPLNVSCCEGTGCNHPYRSGGAPRPGPGALSLASTLLVTVRLWGGVLLWT